MIQHMLHIGTEIISSDTEYKTLKKNNLQRNLWFEGWISTVVINQKYNPIHTFSFINIVLGHTLRIQQGCKMHMPPAFKENEV